MIRVLIAVLLVSQPGLALAANPEPRKECEDLNIVLATSVDRLIKGDYSNRVRIALEAHKRLNCPAEDLLTVLNLQEIKKPKK